jgi:hypothetical protein
MMHQGVHYENGEFCTDRNWVTCAIGMAPLSMLICRATGLLGLTLTGTKLG